MSRLIVLSNRVKLPCTNPMAGGLAVALQEVLSDTGGIWLGWNGEITDVNKVADVNKVTDMMLNAAGENAVGNNTFSTCEQKNVSYVTTALTADEYQYFYCGFANNVLWAMLHERKDKISQAPRDYHCYEQVNRKFAEQLWRMAAPDDVIWVHDYHFFSVAQYCRELGMSNRMGFFLHIPFAPLDCWQTLAETPNLLQHLAQFDVVGVQTQADKAHCQSVFAAYQQPLPPKLQAYPIGVNVKKIQQQTATPLATQTGLTKSTSSSENAMLKNVKTIIAVDRIDYSKGILERFTAFANVLSQYPDLQGKLQLRQIACPSRLDLTAYQQLYRDVQQQVVRVNEQFAHTNLLAIDYSETMLPHERLMGLFRQSDICWVNSLKDGMNLVAKEYIAAQNPANPGVLILSQQAGAAEQMRAAVQVNPYDNASQIAGLMTAYHMPLAERQTRYQTLLAGLQQDNIGVWRERFLHDLYANADQTT